MLNDKMQSALNTHINAEIYSAYLYYAMSAHFETRNLKGMAHWMRVQAQEELVHMQKFFAYINDRDGKVELGKVGAPPSEWRSPVAVFQDVYTHECKVSGLINRLVDMAQSEGDRATYSFLQWFVSEQVEEEATAKEIVGQLTLVGEQGHALFMMDRELGQRIFTPAPTQ